MNFSQREWGGNDGFSVLGSIRLDRHRDHASSATAGLSIAFVRADQNKGERYGFVTAIKCAIAFIAVARYETTTATPSNRPTGFLARCGMYGFRKSKTSHGEDSMRAF